jgi:hypothetical protein
MTEDSFLDGSLFLIISNDTWYGDIIIYLQTQFFWPDLPSVDHHHIRYQSRQYIILGDTLYRHGINSIFRRCLTYDEVEKYLNDCNSRAYESHMSGYATTQNILRVGYLWPSLFKDCINAIHKYHACQTYNHKI